MREEIDGYSGLLSFSCRDGSVERMSTKSIFINR